MSAILIPHGTISKGRDIPPSDILRPDGTHYDRFLQAEVGEDARGAAVTVLSAFARLGLEPWTEARELAALERGPARTRLAKRLSAMGDMPSLDLRSGDVLTKLVGLLPRQESPRVADLAGRVAQGGAQIPAFQLATAFALVVVLAWIYWLAQTG